MTHQVSIKLGDNELLLETGKMAKQANGAVVAKFGGGVVLATVCCSEQEVEGLDYVPLQVEYNEKYYAAGKIPGGFMKREGRPRDKEILVSRLIDRPMRPLFDKKFKRDIQVVPTTISTDMLNPPDVVAIVAASAAVVISDIPFDGPIGAVRVAYCNNEYIINPTFAQIAESQLEIIVAGTEHGITMVEGGAKEISEEILLNAIEKARSSIVDICTALNELRRVAGKKKIVISASDKKLSQETAVRTFAEARLETACFVMGKNNRRDAIRAVKEETLENFKDSIPDEEKGLFSALFEDMEYEIVRKSILERKVRTDGRGPEDIRPIDCEIDVLPRTHGSALFTRGETQALAITTLGTVFDEQIMDDIDGEKRYDYFMLHYNFPPFSVGETGRLGTGRREIGHGNLAKRAVAGVLPAKDDFPYTIRIVSEVLESNGSSSMATVCAGTLSLLNAGVPIKKPVAGIAMGLVTDNNNTVVLSDILGEEDHLGDMDFKVAGTENGITAFQMDIKISGVSAEIMRTALEQARRGRLHILEIMNKTIAVPSSTISEFAPKIINFQVDTDKIGAIIGPGGKNIKAISEKNDVNINIENDGKVTIYGKLQKTAEDAERMIKAMIEEPEVGRIYDGTVRRIMDFGAFIEILPGKEGLCHISKLSRKRVNKVEDVLSLDQQVKIKLVEIDKMGRLNLSYVDANDTGEPEDAAAEEAPPEPRWRKT
ncbi:MAG: polyribonucleotide nucleotidyltransferase [Spirochaetales bacterium]|nr:MAG: polyribonucleotide nucleotidyltransferase [Spirochaetales bacterium]